METLSSATSSGRKTPGLVHRVILFIGLARNYRSVHQSTKKGVRDELSISSLSAYGSARISDVPGTESNGSLHGGSLCEKRGRRNDTISSRGARRRGRRLDHAN